MIRATLLRHDRQDILTRSGRQDILTNCSTPGGDRDGEAFGAADRLKQAVSALFGNAQQAGAIRDDVELPEVYALLAGASRADRLNNAAAGSGML
jgi:hypothetical protein